MLHKRNLYDILATKATKLLFFRKVARNAPMLTKQFLQGSPPLPGKVVVYVPCPAPLQGLHFLVPWPRYSPCKKSLKNSSAKLLKRKPGKSAMRLLVLSFKGRLPRKGVKIDGLPIREIGDTLGTILLLLLVRSLRDRLPR